MRTAPRSALGENMAADDVQEIERKIAELRARWPSHSVPPAMWQELEELEEELQKAQPTDGQEGHAGKEGAGQLQ